MSIDTKHRDPQERADLERAWRHFEEGTPFDPDLARRIQERAETMRQETFERIGMLDEETVNRLVRNDE